MRLLRIVPLVAALGGMIACDEPPLEVTADAFILTGPEFLTGDPARPRARGLMVQDGRIVQLLDAEDVGREAATGLAVHRLAGALAVPGLVDAHAHVLGYGLARAGVDLVGAESLDETLARVAAYAETHPDAAWILGRGWDQNDWTEKAWPTADALESAVPGRPVALRRVDGHAVWVNRAALEAAGVTRDTADPDGGRILRDASGAPLGVLVDNAEGLIDRVIPGPDAARIEEAYLLAGRELAALGLTGVHDMGLDSDAWEVLVRLSGEGRFPLRIHAYASDGSALHERVLESGPIDAGRVRVVGVKLYADGALGSRGARLLEPYDDEPGTLGLWVTTPEEIAGRVDALAEAGLQPAIHAIGDAANRSVLDTYAAAMKTHRGFAGLRPRVEHVQVVAPADLPRFAELGVVASVQPTHATSDMPWAEDRIGPQRVAGAYAWRTLAGTGARLALGSDFPVESADPRLGLLAAVTRAAPDGTPAGGWRAHEALELGEALAGFSAGAAFAVSRDDELGRIAPGYLCDLTVFSEDLTRVPPARLKDVGIAATVVAGEIVRPAIGEAQAD